MFTRSRLLTALAALSFSASPLFADQLQLTGNVRDFKRGDQAGGHPDFETAGSMNRFGHVLRMVTMSLGEDGKPVYNASRPSKDTMQSAASFNQWYRDTPGVNLSAPMTLTLSNGQDGPGGVYTFQSNAFWPIDNAMFGNQGLSHNFHFTFELHTKFTYVPGQSFTFIGDDDVWVFINGKRVIDLGGVHAAITGSVLLFDGKAFVENAHFAVGGMVQKVSTSMRNDLHAKWAAAGMPGTCPIQTDRRYIDLEIQDGAPCTLDFFFAERHTVMANFRIDTSIFLEPLPTTTISPTYD